MAAGLLSCGQQEKQLFREEYYYSLHMERKKPVLQMELYFFG